MLISVVSASNPIALSENTDGMKLRPVIAAAAPVGVSELLCGVFFFK